MTRPHFIRAIAGAAALLAVLSQSVRGEPAPDYEAFRIIAARNIFNPNRIPGRPATTPDATPLQPAVPPPPPSAVIALVGTMSYEKGTFAFFDGTLPDYRKAVKLRDTIAGYSVTAIGPDLVVLALDKESLTLKVGQQLRCEGGQWRLTEAGALPEAAPGGAPQGTQTTTGASSPEANEVLRRLMQRREQELR